MMNTLRQATRLVWRRPSPRCLRAFATATDVPRQERQPSDDHVKLVEVGPRDGLQNEKSIIPLFTKIELIERLARTGLTSIEAGSFVSPQWVPQMESSDEILKHILQHKIQSPSQMTYSFLAPNLRGLSDAATILKDHLDDFVTAIDSSATQKPRVELAVFAAATESFSQRNLNCNIATSLERFRDVIAEAKHAVPGIRVRAYISVALGCPFEGHDVDPHTVARIAANLLEMGADEVALGDTTGMGTAPRTALLLRTMSAVGICTEDISMHFHNTYGQALVNTAVSLEYGIRTFDSSVGGLGGCPYSPGATGNIATEDMVYFMESLGMKTQVDLDAVADIGQWITAEIGKGNDSAVGKAVLGARQLKQSSAPR